MKRILLMIVSLLAIGSIATAKEKIILLNEGNWQTDNGTMTYFEDDKVVSNKWFREKSG